MTRSSALAIDSFIDKKAKLREEFDISEEGKELHSIKSIKRRNMTQITTMIDENINRIFKINELNNKRGRFSNDVYNIKRHKYELKGILKEGRKD